MGWERTRQEFAVVRDKTYLATAAVGGMHRRTREALARWNDFTCAQGAAEEHEYFALLGEARAEVAGLLGVEPADIGFGLNTSLLMNMLALMLKDGPEREVLLPADEFPASVLAWHHHGFRVRLIPLRDGRLETQDVISKLGRRTAAVVVSGVQFLHGFRMDLEGLGEELARRGVPFIVNGTQMLGAFPIALEEAKVSAFAASCHKWFCAGIGHAVFYASPAFRAGRSWPLPGWCSVENPWAMANDPPQIRADCSAIELGSLPFAQVAAIMESCRITRELGQEAIATRVLELSDLLENELRQLPVNINSFRGEQERKSGIIGFTPRDPDRCEQIVAALHERRIIINGRRGSLRASVHYYNDAQDIAVLGAALRELL